jgi:hypothetical protein
VLFGFSFLVWTVRLDGAELAGSASCRDCHAGFFEKWSTSWHGLSLRPYTYVAGEIEPPVSDFQIGEESYRVELRAGRVVVSKDGRERFHHDS